MLRLSVVKTCAEAAGFANTRTQSIDHRWNRWMCDAANEKNHQRRLAGRIHARSDAHALHPSHVPQLIHVLRMHNLGALHLCLRNRIDNLWWRRALFAVAALVGGRT